MERKNKKVNANPYETLTEVEILEKLEKSRESAAQGMYRDAADVSRDMRAYDKLNNRYIYK